MSFTITTALSASESGVGSVALVDFSSFGYRWHGTSRTNVAASQATRMTEETLTNERSCMRYYGKV